MERTRHYQTATKDSLTERQCEVLALIAAGKTNPEIAERLGITLDGAKFHVREILSKLEVDSREEAAEWWKAQRGIGGRLASFMRALLPASWLKPLVASTALGGVALGAVVVTMAINGGSSSADGNHDSAVADIRTGCDPNIVQWRVEPVLDAQVGMRFVMTAAVRGECVLSTNVTLYAYGMMDAGAGTTLVGLGHTSLTLGPQVIGNSESPVVVGTISNVCNDAERVMLVIETPNRQFVIDRAYLPPCYAPGQPAAFTAKWSPDVSSMNPVAIPPAATTFVPCAPENVAWRASTALDPETGLRFEIYGSSPTTCQLTTYVYLSALARPGANSESLGVLATTPTALTVPAKSLGLNEELVITGRLANVCQGDEVILQMNAPGFSYTWLEIAEMPPCVSTERPVEFSAVVVR